VRGERTSAERKKRSAQRDLNSLRSCHLYSREHKDYLWPLKFLVPLFTGPPRRQLSVRLSTY
jgi:hypothetical protein